MTALKKNDLLLLLFITIIFVVTGLSVFSTQKTTQRTNPLTWNTELDGLSQHPALYYEKVEQ